MQITYHCSELRELIRHQRAAGKRIGFVPTMGNLHDGHLSLVRKAKEVCDIVVASIFVNPLQFGANEDLDRYPRTFEADVQKLESVACDLLFFPSVDEVYPNGMDEQAKVIVPVMTNVLCGASRPGHFDGVTTVVCKLFNMVQADVAVFGLKDFQQLAVIRRMAEDLCIPIEIIGADIAREPDGLAMSSRNGYISSEERPRVIVLNQTLNWIKNEILGGNRNFSELERRGTEKISAAGFRPDYLKICSNKTLNAPSCDDAELVVLGAMHTADARLIDNLAFVV